jgi:hypothetical protein
MVQKYPAREMMSLLFSCLTDIERGTPAFIIPFKRPLLCATDNYCPFEDAAVAKSHGVPISGGAPAIARRQAFGDELEKEGTVMAQFLKKFKGLIELFCQQVPSE